MKQSDLEKDVAELEQRVKELEQELLPVRVVPRRTWPACPPYTPYRPSWRFVPPYPSPYRPPYVERCCPYLDKCTACPYRHQIAWGDNATDTNWAADDGSIWRITA